MSTRAATTLESMPPLKRTATRGVDDVPEGITSLTAVAMVSISPVMWFYEFYCVIILKIENFVDDIVCRSEASVRCNMCSCAIKRGQLRYLVKAWTLVVT